MFRRYLVVHVAIDARMNPKRAVALQGGVEVAAALAKMVVGGVAESEHGKFHPAEIETVTVHHGSPERCSVVGRFAVLVCARHDQHNSWLA